MSSRYLPVFPTPSHPRSENHPSNIFVQAFIKGQEAAAQRTRYGNYWKLQEFWANGITEHRAVVDQFVEPIVEKAFARQRGGLADKETDADLVSSLVREMNGRWDLLYYFLCSRCADVHAIKDELLNILVAARDTVSFKSSGSRYRRITVFLRQLRSSPLGCMLLQETLL